MDTIAFAAMQVASQRPPPPPSSSNAPPAASQNQQSVSLQRQPSFSSFPSSRSPSAISIRNDRKTRSPQPPMVREALQPEDIDSASSSQASSRLSVPERTPRTNTKLRSQYPADAIENHVEYILVASFDIDRGSIMEHQYPAAISGDETMLAELMLPDQAHMRNQDWTIFFLHKDTTAEEEEREARRERRRKRRRRKEGLDDEDGSDGEEVDMDDDEDGDYDTESEDEPDPDGPPLVYVLNLVNTKLDNTVKRYAEAQHPTSKANMRQRLNCQSNGNLHATLFPAHI
jgi:hypothetical protein